MKQIIVLRKDLSMDVGKLISQACHACLEASEAAKKRDRAIWKAW
ncbi:MAG: peptidyl-tRNA hydrolase, partial [Aliifodinibius sp.]|nr:peptidyl-tRNA hydrolase [Fodinibius sp.]NIV09747.1 peptidyl-tRNA hydrolase [Fodinibius sp.]NIY23273.1 peptidyl-tRNA hydrolase [Fodinibius sp.]